MSRAPLVLASASPRRREQLARCGFDFSIQPADIDEVLAPAELPHEGATRLAVEKALACRDRVGAGAVILAADTCVAVDGLVLGKPTDFDDALRMLALLSGRNHRVITGWAVLSTSSRETLLSGLGVSIVRMREIPRREAIEYASGSEPYDKAGAYAAQGDGKRFIAAVIGPFDNVVGLPLAPVCRALARFGITPLRQ